MGNENHLPSYYGGVITLLLACVFCIYYFIVELDLMFDRKDDVRKMAFVKDTRLLNDDERVNYTIVFDNLGQTNETDVLGKSKFKLGDSILIGFDSSNLEGISIIAFEQDHKFNIMVLSIAVVTLVVSIVLMLLFKEEILKLDPSVIFRGT